MTSPACMCCGAAVEDDVHVLVGCPATGSDGWLGAFLQAWVAAGAAAEVRVRKPPEAWVQDRRVMLMAALIPVGLRQYAGSMGEGEWLRLARGLHEALAVRLADVMQRRGRLMAAAMAVRQADNSTREAAAPPRGRAGFGEARRLPVAELVAIERTQGRGVLPGQAPARVEAEVRREQAAANAGMLTWLRDRVRHLPREDGDPGARGEPTVALLLLWEADHDRGFPSAATSWAKRTEGFGWRLLQEVQAHPELGLQSAARVRRPLGDGLRATTQRWWGVRIPDTVGEAFLSRWRAMLLEQYAAQRAAPGGDPDTDDEAGQVEPSYSSSSSSGGTFMVEGSRGRRRRRSSSGEGSPGRQRQRQRRRVDGPSGRGRKRGSSAARHAPQEAKRRRPTAPASAESTTTVTSTVAAAAALVAQAAGEEVGAPLPPFGWWCGRSSPVLPP